MTNPFSPPPGPATTPQQPASTARISAADEAPHVAATHGSPPAVGDNESNLGEPTLPFRDDAELSAKRSKIRIALIAGILGALIGGGATAGTIAFLDSREEARAARKVAEAADARGRILPDAMTTCNLDPASAGLTLGDADMTLSIDMRGEDDLTGTSYEGISCLLSTLNVPSAVSSHIAQTTSMDGRQTETWDGIEFSWSYHPDRGLDGVLTVTDDKTS